MQIMSKVESLTERRQRILSHLKDHGRTTVQTFSEMFQVSAVTIRQDLRDLEKDGGLVRVHGGAIVNEAVQKVEAGFGIRAVENIEEKRIIARLAAAMVKDGYAIGMDGSTTVFTMAPFLKSLSSLIVVTNSIALTSFFSDSPHITVLLPGGQLRVDSMTIVNRPETLPAINLNLGFFSAHGITLEQGITEMSHEEGEFKQHIIDRCDDTVVLMDSSKWGRIGPYTYSRSNEIGHILTTDRVSPEQVQAFTQNGANITICRTNEKK